MRSVSLVPAAAVIASSAWAVIAAFRIGAWLSHHGVQVNWFWYRVTMPWYIGRYKKMTTEIDGKPGPLYLQFLVAINLALVLAILMIITEAVARR